jgi:outer membrane biosynthesis protein TonB
MKSQVFILSMLFSSLCLAETAPYAPAATQQPKEANLKEDDCPPPTPKKKVCPKPKPKPKPVPKCEPKVITKTVVKTVTLPPEIKTVVKTETKTVEVEKKVYVEGPKNTLNVLAGTGPSGIVVDTYETQQRNGEYAVRKESERGAIFGLQYQYHITPSWNVGVTAISNQSYLGVAGFSW